MVQKFDKYSFLKENFENNILETWNQNGSTRNVKFETLLWSPSPPSWLLRTNLCSEIEDIYY